MLARMIDEADMIRGKAPRRRNLLTVRNVTDRSDGTTIVKFILAQPTCYPTTIKRKGQPAIEGAPIFTASAQWPVETNV